MNWPTTFARVRSESVKIPGYSETRKKLLTPGDDVLSLMAEVAAKLQRQGDGESVAVVVHLFAMLSCVAEWRDALAFVVDTIAFAETIGMVEKYGSRDKALAEFAPEIAYKCQEALGEGDK